MTFDPSVADLPRPRRCAVCQGPLRGNERPGEGVECTGRCWRLFQEFLDDMREGVLTEHLYDPSEMPRD